MFKVPGSWMKAKNKQNTPVIYILILYLNFVFSFNPEPRASNLEPFSEGKAMITNIEEPIKVGVVFGNERKITPVWFIWNKRRYDIKEITYSWLSKEGRSMLYNFSVSDGSTLYELSYNAESLRWMLTAVEA